MFVLCGVKECFDPGSRFWRRAKKSARCRSTAVQLPYPLRGHVAHGNRSNRFGRMLINKIYRRQITQRGAMPRRENTHYAAPFTSTHVHMYTVHGASRAGLVSNSFSREFSRPLSRREPPIRLVFALYVPGTHQHPYSRTRPGIQRLTLPPLRSPQAVALARQQL